MGVVGAQAEYDGPNREVFIQVATHDGRIYLDLADENWQVVEINANGWRVLADAPVRFIRRRGMQALPVPERGGDIRLLRKHINVKDGDDFILVVSCLLCALGGRGPFVVLDVTGEAGTAKSTLLKMLRDLIDPNKSALRAPPRNDHELFIAAGNAFVLAYDNLSWLPDWLSDSLSRLATGGGFAARQLYSDDEERLFDAMRPIVLGAIEKVVVKGDLGEREVAIQLDLIPENKRRPESEVWVAFEQDRPKILGGLLDAIAHGLRHLPDVKVERLPRMADYFRWAIACGDGLLWDKGAFANAYWANREGSTLDIVEADPVASAVYAMMTHERAPRVWEGTATKLLSDLEKILTDKETQSKQWPASSVALGRRFKRIATPLRRLGIEIVRQRSGPARNRIVTITCVEDVRNNLSHLSNLSAPGPTPSRKSLNNNDFSDADRKDRLDSNLQKTPYADRQRRFSYDLARERKVRDAEQAVARRSKPRSVNFEHRRTQRHDKDDE